MTAAELLREKLKANLPFTKEEFIEEIFKDIEVNGYSSFICDRHISETKLMHGHTIKLQHEQIICEWARSEGFTISHKPNRHGVRCVVFMI